MPPSVRVMIYVVIVCLERPVERNTSKASELSTITASKSKTGRRCAPEADRPAAPLFVLLY